jgi:5'-3' exonuclease
MQMGLTLLVDTSSLVYRALFSNPDSISTQSGKPINAAYGFLGMLARLVQDHDPAFLACATDEAWRPEWRVELLPQYKSARALPGSAQEEAEGRLEPQMPILFELLDALGVPVVGHDDAEAEDVIGTLAARAKGPVAIVSGDRDLIQLVRDPVEKLLFTLRGVSDLGVYDEAGVLAKYGVPADRYAEFAILRGDPSDGLPGVRGVGEKTARALVQEFPSMDAMLEAAEAGTLVIKPGVRSKLLESRGYLDDMRRLVPVNGEAPLSLWAGERDPSLIEDAAELGLKGPVQRLFAALESAHAE